MKNNLAALICGAALLSAGPVLAQSPAVLSFTQGGQFRLGISNTDPNLLLVSGDRITAITAQGGMLADKRTTSAGGVLFTSVATRTFTLFVETALGQSFSVVATPQEGEGRVYRLVSAEPPARPQTRQWETAQAYETLLVSLNRSALNDTLPDGYGEVSPLRDALRVPAGLTATPERAMAGDLLRMDRYRLRNTTGHDVVLREPDFHLPGVRAVMFDRPARTLTAGGSLVVTVIRAAGEGQDGRS